MGVGGNFWQLLKPHGRREGPDFLRDKRVAVDLSFWIVQHESALAARCRNPCALKPHLRLTFFRTVNLFAKMGAFPVFVLDGEPSPLKAKARIERFFRATGIDVSANCPLPEGGVPVKRNRVFTRFVEECVELLEHLGMPVIRARSEAEALCAQLNTEGHVDACITADSDTLLFGATCVIKCIHYNSSEPFECYYISDIEAGLGLKRKQLIAISLLVGNDHDLKGVTGIGVETAVRFVQLFTEEEILDRLSEAGKEGLLSQIMTKSPLDPHASSPDAVSVTRRIPHCSNCGHPGSRKAHVKTACETCFAIDRENCISKLAGFKCGCPSCDEGRRIKGCKSHESWQLKVCQKISKEQNFPNKDIMDIYLSKNNGSYHENDGPLLLWENPRVDVLVDFLVYHLHWEPSYIRQRILPMLSTIFLREMTSYPVHGLLLLGQYEFHSIHRVKKRYGHHYYVVKWKRAAPNFTLDEEISVKQASDTDDEVRGSDILGDADFLDAEDAPEILNDEGGWFLVTDENMGLVEAAFPEEVRRFKTEKELKASNSKRKKLGEGAKSPETPYSKATQLSITQFYRSTKVHAQTDQEKKKLKLPNPCPPQKDAEKNFSKSVRRRLLFD